jgi:hypothetical protein
MIYPAGDCPAAIEKSALSSPWYLFKDHFFPNVHTFHIKWTGALAGTGTWGGLYPPREKTGYPSVRTFIFEIDRLDEAEVTMLFHHFKFPDLRNFTQKIALQLEQIEDECEVLGEIMQEQPMNWPALETLTLDVNVDAIEVTGVSFCVRFRLMPRHVSTNLTLRFW